MGTIERFEIRCTAQVGERDRADAANRTLHRVATTVLPAALDRLLPHGNLDVGSVSTHLPEAILDHDDETIALLWAAEIAAAVRADPRVGAASQSATAPSGAAGPDVADNDTVGSTPSGRRRVLAVLRDPFVAWCRSRQDHGDARRDATDELREALRNLGVVAPTVEIDIAAPTSALDALVDVVGSASLTTVEDLARWLVSTGATSTEPAQRTPQQVLDSDRESRGDGAPTAPPDATDAKDAVDDAADPSADTTHRDELHRSTVGGLTLLYPWLSTLMSSASELFGDVVESRIGALHLLVTDPSPDDALIRVLAGTTPTANVDWRSVATVQHELLDERVAELWTAFAGLLPGTWSAATLRHELVVRPSWIERANDEWIVFQGARPLDLLLRQLPYPLEYFAFAWSDPISVRWPHG